MRTILKLSAVAGMLLVLPLTASPSGRIVVNDAQCSGGTCCPETRSTCYPGSCSGPWWSESNRYWRNDGKACGGGTTLVP